MRCHNTKPRTSVQPAIWLLSLFFLLLSCATWSPRSSAAGFAASWPYKAEVIHSQQMVVVEAKSIHSQSGQLSLQQYIGGQWQSVLSGIPVTFGSKGIGKTKEGDGRTPSGIYRLGSGFGSAANPGGLRISYTRTSKQDYWVDDPFSSQYNQWVNYAGNPDQRWRSYERLQQPLYKYAIILKYNDDPVVSGKGSAIFLHIWRAAGKPTAGCIAMSESNLLQLMRLLDPDLSPAIAIGISG
jgi:L,D-peptidoglycan transpeptidase YkuD (ErfK/YbiS/YcfS/YnhG family)